MQPAVVTVEDEELVRRLTDAGPETAPPMGIDGNLPQNPPARFCNTPLRLEKTL
jgi:hypothetical protein